MNLDLKILHFLGGHLSGGAAKGAYFLHRALIEAGVDSMIFTNGDPIPSDPTVISTRHSVLSYTKTQLLSQGDGLLTRLHPRRTRQLFSTGFFGFDIDSKITRFCPDIVHLHWVNAGVLRIKSLARISKPLVWTLRDMWPMTGGCHYSMGCDRFLNQCGFCPQLGSRKENDLSRRVHEHKQKHLPESLNIVGTSDWMSELARQSSLLGSYPITTIYNGIDTRVFIPTSKPECREALGLPKDRKIILFGCQSIDDPFKGIDLLLKAFEVISRDDLFVVFFGRGGEKISKQLQLPGKNLGFISGLDELGRIYSAADVFAAPAKTEAFGKTTVEAMACKTPVVCFDNAGQAEIVEHKVNGYKAKPFEPEDLARGIEWILADNKRHEALCKAARDAAVNRFDITVATRKYLELYESLIH